MKQKHSHLIDRLLRFDASGHSPCVGHCVNDAEGYCHACRRHADEIDAWRDAKPALRQQVWARLPHALDDCRIDTMRLPLSPQDSTALAIDTLARGGAWAVGGGGVYAYAHRLIDQAEGVLTAESSDASTTIRLDLSGRMRVLAWTGGGTGGSGESVETGQTGQTRQLKDPFSTLPLVLVIPRVRLNLPCHHAPTPLKNDQIDCGFGLEHCQIITDKNGDKNGDIILKTMLAEARIKTPKNRPQPKSKPNLPQGLALPQAFIPAAMLLPKGTDPF